MTTLAIATLAAGVGIGVLFVVAGLTGRRLLSTPTSSVGPERTERRTRAAHLGGSVVAALLAWVATGWPVGGALTGLTLWFLPGVLGGKAARSEAIARTEAIASWTEMIRDSIVAASGIEEAIAATAPVAPAPIGREVRSMVRRLEHHTLPDALVEFGHDLHHPSGDLVVASLVTASRLEASDMSGLLTRLADATRGEARMRIRVEVGRTRVRTATKVIAGVLVVSVAFLALVNRDYLGVYDSGVGQIVLALVGATFATGGWLLARMAAIDLPDRFTARVTQPGIAT